MYSFVLQDWITIRGTNTTPIIQTESDWLDMSPYQDCVAWVDVTEQIGTPTLAFETAPLPEDRLFVQMNTTAISLTVPGTPAPQVIQMLMGSAAVPVAQFLRWKVTGPASPWDVTFRILLAANAPGLQQPDATTSMDFLLRPEM